jgi:hypothetical protein
MREKRIHADNVGMPPQTPKPMNPAAIRNFGSYLAEYAHRANTLAGDMEKHQIDDVTVKAYAALPNVMSNLYRFFNSLEPAVTKELVQRGAFVSPPKPGPTKRRPVKKSPQRRNRA